MGNKINTHGLRLGVNKTWNSIWYSDNKNFSKALHQDIKIKELVREKLNVAGLDSIVIRRSENVMDVDVFVARPGVAIGRGGTGMDTLKADIAKLSKSQVNVNINEVKKPDASARIIARTIADGIEKRLPLKPLMENCKQKAEAAGVNGIRILVSGRIGGSSQARNVKTTFGQVPLQTIKATIDYSYERAATSDNGIYGVKVWVYKSKI